MLVTFQLQYFICIWPASIFMVYLVYLPNVTCLAPAVRPLSPSIRKPNKKWFAHNPSCHIKFYKKYQSNKSCTLVYGPLPHITSRPKRKWLSRFTISRNRRGVTCNDCRKLVKQPLGWPLTVQGFIILRCVCPRSERWPNLRLLVFRRGRNIAKSDY
jgi:hypothetical protein